MLFVVVVVLVVVSLYGFEDKIYIMITCPCNEHPLYTPLLYSKTRVYRGILIFLIFALKHKL